MDVTKSHVSQIRPGDNRWQVARLSTVPSSPAPYCRLRPSRAGKRVEPSLPGARILGPENDLEMF
jgi:hypothetical protein